MIISRLSALSPFPPSWMPLTSCHTRLGRRGCLQISVSVDEVSPGSWEYSAILNRKKSYHNSKRQTRFQQQQPNLYSPQPSLQFVTTVFIVSKVHPVLSRPLRLLRKLFNPSVSLGFAIDFCSLL